ncbi:MAG: bifunctional DNA primase/helicase, partial [Komarekiella atlantica HA4396-MV6]|nr:bifunctional DNA primase/helicase [Komarekiella atlantica HA4396-MV6]
YPAPPTIVTQKDRSQRDNLPFSFDWGNYSARWLARFNLGLHHILKRLIAGDEITASDSNLLNMRAIANDCAAHIKAILGFTIPSDCEPVWLLATLVEQLGLKLTCRKQGPRGQQVKIYSLAQEELEFATQVMAHRQNKREEKAQTQLQHEFNPNQAPVSTPPHNAIGNPLSGGVDTTQLEPSNGVRPTLLHCVETLRSGIAKGVDAIKSILKRWTSNLRWQTVLELEAIAANELRSLEQAVPQFYQWLSEEELPMEG